MDQTSSPTPQRKPPSATVIAPWFLAAALATIALAVVLIPKGGNASTNLRLPPSVTAANCIAVAKSAGLLKQKMSGARVGQYYTAWVEKLGGDKPTRSTLFNAGIAVAVCLR